MNTRIVLLFLLFSGGLKAQQFHHSYSVDLPDSLSKVRPARVDLNNDGIVDILLLSETYTGHSFLQVMKGDTTITPFLHWHRTMTIGPVMSFAVTDYDGDNRLDVVIASADGRTAVYINRGNFLFSENLLPLPAFSALLVVDLDSDGKGEWVLSDEKANDGRLFVFRQTGAFMWTLAHDSLHVAAASLGSTDENSDGRTDIFVSGVVGADSIVSTILLSDGQLGFTRGARFDFIGTSSSADVNADGIFDFLVMGRNKNGVAGSRLFESTAGTHRALDIPASLRDASPFLADLNSDGVVDYNFRGTKGVDTLNVLTYAENNFDTIASVGYRGHVFGDEDLDGDLDLLVVLKSTRLKVLSYTNMTAVNKAPSMPKRAVVMNVFDRAFYYWDQSSDDHTPQLAITYDLFVDRPGALAAEFDLLNEKRLSVTHGNNGTQNFKLVRNSVGSPFAVQAVDNSFHASRPCVGSKSPCSATPVTKVFICAGEKATLDAPHEALWFSFSDGYLGTHVSLALQPSASDTVFYYDPAGQGCLALGVIQLVVTNDVVRKVEERHACVNQVLRLQVEDSWSTVTWHSYKRGSLGAGPSIDVVVTEADTITAIMKNASGCTRRDKTVVKISTPLVTVSPELVRIAKGSDVQLTAGGATRYEWQPGTGLSDSNIPSPVASPLVTTTYEVTAFDSLGCAGSAAVTITVEYGGFVPSLFTPNEDGNNDEIRIYGLTEVHDFVFTIHNREGNVVYRTNNLDEATQKGWDGTRQGTRQPAGVYFWKVKGELGSGETLLLNGKETGSIVLVR